MMGTKSAIASLAVVSMLGLAQSGACGGRSEPESLELEIEIGGAETTADPEVYRVKQGDIVTLRANPDEPGRLHLHGYDLEIAVGPGETEGIEITANATGRYRIAFHEEHEGTHDDPKGIDLAEHAGLFESETLEGGDDFSFTIVDDLAGATVPYHNYMDHSMLGSIRVTHDARSDRVHIEVRDDGFDPSEVEARPGATVVWTVATDSRVRIASGVSPGAEGEDEHEDEEGAEESERTVGFLEVHPR